MSVRRASRNKKTAPQRVAVSLLGAPRIEVGGRAVEFDTRKALAILAFLVLSGGRQPRERLAAMFWPEADPERARGALRRTLSTVRTSPVGDRLDADTVTAALRTEGIDVDALRFRELRAAGRHADAVRLYAGDFLAGFSLRDAPGFEEWQNAYADALRADLADSLESLIRKEREAGRMPSALAHARRRLELDPLNEAAHREVMRLHALSGDRSAAIRQYHDCVHMLDRELGVAPLQETAALHDAIKAGSVPREETVATPDRTAARNVDEAVGDLYTLHGAYAKAIASYEAALGAAAARSKPGIERKIAEVFHRRGDWEHAEEHYKMAAQTDDVTEQAQAVADHSLVAHRRGDAERALRLARKALQLAERGRDDRAVAQAHNILGVLTQDRKHLERALELALRLGDPAVEVAALNNLALAELRGGDAIRALPHAEQALERSGALADRHREAALHNNLADVMRILGRGEESMRHLKRAVAIFGDIGGAREPEVWKLVEW